MPDLQAPSCGVRFKLLTVVYVVPLLCVTATVPGCSKPDSSFTSYTVDRGDVVVRCVQAGTLESANQVQIACEVAAHSYGGFRASGAEVLWIVRDGAAVKKGDVLVELNDALLKELRDDWDVKVVQSEGRYRQAEIRYKNQISRRETELADITARLRQAELSKTAFDGIHEILVGQASESARLSHEGAKLQNIVRKVAEALDRIGQRVPGIGSPEEEGLAYQKQLAEFAKTVSDLEMMKKYEHPLKQEELKVTLETTKRALAQSQLDYEAVLEQLAAELSTVQATLNTQRERLRHYEDQINKCKIRAPHDGLVVYASSGEEDEIAAGALLRERQKILVLHDLSKCRFRVPLPSTDVERVQVGMTASIDVGADLSRQCTGAVAGVERRGNTWDALVAIEEVLPLRPGAIATVEIALNHRDNVTRIPLESFKSRAGRDFCFVMMPHGLEQRTLTLGAVGDRYAEVIDGLQEGDTIVLDVEAADTIATRSGR